MSGIINGIRKIRWGNVTKWLEGNYINLFLGKVIRKVVIFQRSGDQRGWP